MWIVSQLGLFALEELMAEVVYLGIKHTFERQERLDSPSLKDKSALRGAVLGNQRVREEALLLTDSWAARVSGFPFSITAMPCSGSCCFFNCIYFFSRFSAAKSIC